MKFILCFVIILALFAALRTQRPWQHQHRSDRERAFTVRSVAAFTLLGLVFVGAFLFLPGKARVVMTIPAFFLAVTLGKAWLNTRARLRREEAARVDFERMKRVGGTV